jgi:hypothetical protein
MPQAEDLRRERVQASVAAQVAELLERQQRAPRAGARHADGARDVGDGQPAAGMAERGDDRQAALDRANVVRVA